MDILLTIIASILLLVGFLVICRSSAEDEYYEDDLEDEPAPSSPPGKETGKETESP
ncbi:MAG: hypothetical protein ACE5ER_03095 [Nitrospinaceae bacterium]